jgi:tetratricopeptide (TPR) repeat protein
MLRILGICVVLSVLVPAAARADDLQEATRLLDIMEYKKALKAADRVLMSPASGPHELVAAYRIKGLSLSALGKANRSLAAFRKLLAIDPAFRLSDDISPKLAAPFYQAVAMLRTQKALALEHHPPRPPAALAGSTLKITLKSDPLRMVRRVELRFSSDLDGKERKMVARIKKAKTVAMKLPAGFTAGEIRYYFKATSKYGATLAYVGTKQEPFVLAAAKVEAPARLVLAPAPTLTQKPVPPPGSVPPAEPPSHKEMEPAPWYKTWWFWTAAGVATAMIVGGVILATDSGVTLGPADYGIRIE